MAAPDDVMAAIGVPVGHLEPQLALLVAVTQLHQRYRERLPVGTQIPLHELGAVHQRVRVVLVDAADGEEGVALAEPVLLVHLAGAQRQCERLATRGHLLGGDVQRARAAVDRPAELPAPRDGRRPSVVAD